MSNQEINKEKHVNLGWNCTLTDNKNAGLSILKAFILQVTK